MPRGLSGRSESTSSGITRSMPRSSTGRKNRAISANERGGFDSTGHPAGLTASRTERPSSSDLIRPR